VLNNQPQGGLAMRRQQVSVARSDSGSQSYNPRQSSQYYPWQNGQYYYPWQNGRYYYQRQQGWW
jgi:hypothetical protein